MSHQQVWFSVAAELGDALAVRHRDRVANELTPDQIVRSGKIAKERVALIRRKG